MTEEIPFILIFVAVAVVYLLVDFIGNKIVDKGGDAINNARKRKKSSKDQEKTEKLSDRFQDLK